jgi:hypothetical protein
LFCKLNYIQQRVSVPKVKITRKRNPPSIQDPKNAYGFEEGADGELVPQAPPDKDPSIGPAYYNTVSNRFKPLCFILIILLMLNIVICAMQLYSGIPSTNYKGIHFAKYAPRQLNQAAKSSGPGPGEYDVIEPIKIDVEHYHMKGNQDKKPELSIPRFTEMITKNVEKEVRFGPALFFYFKVTIFFYFILLTGHTWTGQV